MSLCMQGKSSVESRERTGREKNVGTLGQPRSTTMSLSYFGRSRQ